MSNNKNSIALPEVQATTTHQLNPPDVSLKDILSLDAFQKKHGDKFTKAQLNWLLRFRDRNGLSESGAVLMSARKFYIVEPLFTQWFFNQQKA